MGCDQSRQKDEQESTRRERQPPPRSDNNPQSARQAVSPPMGIAGSRMEATGQPMGESYTVQRINEDDLFTNITNKTADMFINISELMETMEVRDVKGLSKAYKSLVAAQRNIKSNLQTLPLAADSCAQPEAALSAPLAVGQPEREFMLSLSNDVAEALKAFAISSNESIVAYLPDAKPITA
eukprot:m.33207 g.33207  ORF g.33207 m.33207 type:complete len:182 (+) comp10999_c0_seq2:115-660(+)